MHRKILLDLLEKYAPNDEEALKMKNETRLFVQANKDCFRRELLIGHVTGSAWIVNNARTHVLMMHHRKLNQWFQPGGHCDGDNNVLAVALKEAREETGLINLKIVSGDIYDIDIHLIPAGGISAIKEVPAHYHYDIRFLIEANMDEPLVLTEEANDLAWVSLQKIMMYNDSASIMRMLQKMI